MAVMNTRRKAAWAAAVTVGVAAVTTGAVAGTHYLMDTSSTCMNQGATVVTKGQDGQCAGITDGSYLKFLASDRRFAAIMSKISKENQLVRKSGDFVSVAYLLPIAFGGKESVNTIDEQLEGAYTDQMYGNKNNVTASDGPRIQLLVASDGKDGADWGTAVQRIEQAVTSQHLVAVVGLGVSLDTTTSAINQLIKDKIPVLGSSVTSDAYDDLAGMYRISASNSDHVDALLSYIKQRFTKSFVVKDKNPADTYDVTLVKGFESPVLKRDWTWAFNTATVPGQSMAETLALANDSIDRAVGQICLYSDDVVLFAGRGKQLAVLLGDLGESCTSKKITIVTGDDVTNMPVTAGVRAGLKHAELYYSANANPDEWGGSGCKAIGYGKTAFTAFLNSFTTYKSAGPAGDINAAIADGNAMMGYDVMLTIGAAIRAASSDPTTSTVLRTLENTDVQGASGRIVLSGSGSNPNAKAIPILRYEPPPKIPGFEKLVWSASRADVEGAAAQNQGCR